MSDRVVRALTHDHAFRIVTVTMTDTARAAAATHGLTGQTAEVLGELLTGAVLARELMAPDLRMQVVLRARGGLGSAVADAHPGGLTRGLLNLKKDQTRFEIGGDALMQVTRTLARGDLHQGIVPVDSQEGVSGAFHHYFASSEQVTSAVSLGAEWRDGQIVRAGGYVVQLLPEGRQADLDRMTARLESFPAFSALMADLEADADRVMARVLDGFEHTRVNDSPVHWGCVCDFARVVAALASLGREEVQSLAEKDETLDIGCDYCGKRYAVSHAQLQGLFVES